MSTWGCHVTSRGRERASSSRAQSAVSSESGWISGFCWWISYFSDRLCTFALVRLTSWATETVWGECLTVSEVWAVEGWVESLWNYFLVWYGLSPWSSPLVLQLNSHSVCSFLQATSRLLVNYAEPYRSQILDFLFKVMILDPVSQSSGQNRAHCFAFPAVCSPTLEPLCTYWRWRSEEMLRLQVCVSVCLSVGTSLIFNMTPHVVSNYHIPPEDDCLSALM